jgi:hypothetical protein
MGVGPWVALLLALVPALAAAGDGTCRRVLRRMARAEPTFYAVESERLPYEGVAVRPGVLEDGVLVRRVTFQGRDGTTWDGEERISCGDGHLLLHRFQRLTTRDVEDWVPPVPVLVLPLEEGARWTWTGVLAVGLEGEPLRNVADARYVVGAPEAVAVGAGSFQALPVRGELMVGGTLVRTTDWVLAKAPHTLILREQEFVGADGTLDRIDRWRLARVGEGS